MRTKILSMLKKELREVFRDKKSLMMMLVIPMIIPLIIIGMSALFDTQMKDDGTEYNKVGFSYVPSNVEEEMAKAMGLEVKVGSLEEIEKLYQDDEIYAYVNKDNNVYTINYGMSSESGMGAASLLSQYLESYKGYLQQEKLSSLNVNAKDVLQVIEIREEDKGEESFFASYIVSYAFLFIIMAITVSATYPATDATAGEKERGTLETLLTFPIKPRDIIIGKYLSVSISSIVTGVLSLALAIVSFGIANKSFTIYEVIPISISGSAIVVSLVMIVLYAFFISGICIAIASLAKTFKEAQSALTPVNFICFFPGMIAFMIGVKTTNTLALVPFLNFSLVLNDAAVGVINWGQIFLVVLSTIVYISIIIWYIVRQYKSEKVLFAN